MRNPIALIMWQAAKVKRIKKHKMTVHCERRSMRIERGGIYP